MASREKLEEMRKKTEAVSRLIRQTLRRINIERALLGQLVGEYNRERAELFTDELKTHGYDLLSETPSELMERLVTEFPPEIRLRENDTIIVLNLC